MKKSKTHNYQAERSIQILNKVKTAVFKNKRDQKVLCEYTVYPPESLVNLRTSLGMNQIEFWGRIGISQTAGSFYENGVSAIPIPVLMLIETIYERGIHLSNLTDRKEVEAAVEQKLLEQCA